MKIYVVEDEVTIRREVITLLERYGYETAACEDFPEVITDIEKECPDLILLDINLPYKDGYQLCKEIREMRTTPVIMLTSQDSEMEEVMSLKAGADDFVAKPYHPQVLLAHIETVLKRSAPAAYTDKITYKGVTLNRSSAKLEYQGEVMELTRNELRILNLLMGNPGEVVARDDIMEELWQDGEFIDENTLNVSIVRLRKRLAAMGIENFIETKRGMGYRV